MPFVAPMTAAMGLVLLGLRTPTRTRASRAYEVKVGAHDAGASRRWHLVFGAILVCALPQILYLLSRNFELVLAATGAHGFRPHWDEFRSGSGGGNCGLPGNEDCQLDARRRASRTSVGAQPRGRSARRCWRLVGGVRAGAAGRSSGRSCSASLLYLNWGERRARRLFYLAAWFFAAISTLGKGPAGFGLPDARDARVPRASRPSEEISRAAAHHPRARRSSSSSRACSSSWRSRCPGTSRCTCGTGRPFTDRLIFHDMFNRALHHVHDTNEGDDTSFRFYVWQLGYALFPWTGLAPLGLLWWLRRGDVDARTTTGRTRRCSSACGSSSRFALFSFMGTKFHHYIFPAVPPVGDAHRRRARRHARQDAAGQGRAALRSRYLVGLLAAVGADDARASRGCCRARSSGRSRTGTWPTARCRIGAVLFVVRRGADGAASCGCSGRRTRPREGRRSRRPRTRPRRTRRACWRRGASAGALAARARRRAISSSSPRAPTSPGAIRLLQLFTYNYRRAVARVARLLGGPRRLHASSRRSLVAGASRCARSAGTRSSAMCAFAFVWALWGLDVYMDEDGAALGPARGHRGVLREPRSRPTSCSSPTR